MFAESPGGDQQAGEVERIEGEKQKLDARLGELREQGHKLKDQEKSLEDEAAELEGQIRALAREEARLLEKKKALKEDARKIGDRRTEILGRRKKLQRQQGALQAELAGLDERLSKIREQQAFEEAQKVAAIELEKKPVSRDRPQEQRAHPRVAVEVEVSMHTQHNFYTGLTENLSEGGLFVATYEDLPIGTPVALNIRLPGQDPFQADGEVRWVREHSEFTEDVSPGVGVQFTDLNPEDRARIESFIQTRPPLFYETV